MMDKQPTEAQIKEFWEWGGWKPAINYNDPTTSEEHPPLIDLNNIFKYAVPKLQDCGLRLHMLTQPRGGKDYFCSIGGKYLAHACIYDKDPALALFWAIWEVIHA